MKGYNTSNGYMGYVEGKYILFASEQEYFEFIGRLRGGRAMSKNLFHTDRNKSLFRKRISEKRNEDPLRKRTRQ